jgi:hypothetical protein
VLLVIVDVLGAGKEGLLEDSGVPRLVEGGDAKLLVSVLLDDAEGIVVGVEGGHEDKGNIDTVGGVEMLDLSDSQVEEGHVVLDLESTLGSGHAHGGSETPIDLQDSELVEVLGVCWRWESGIGDDLVFSRRLDAFPITRINVVRITIGIDDAKISSQFYTLSAFGEITSEEVEEGLHLGIEGLRGSMSGDLSSSCQTTKGLTFLVAGSSTVDTRREISFLIDFAATPVVAVLKSM